MNEVMWFLVFFIPAYVANSAPPFFRKAPFGYPIDCGKKFRGKPLLGKNKTWRGLLVGTLFAGLAGYIMQWSGLPFTGWWGFVIGFAALFGDALKSFFKRRMNFAPGASWVPFDQLDFIIVAYAASQWMVSFSLTAIIAGFAIIFFGNLVIQWLAQKTGVKADGL